MGRTRIHLGEDDILYITPVGEADEQHAAKGKEICLKLMNRFGKKKMNVLVDLNSADKQSPKARNQWRNLAEMQDKVALVGLHPVARVVASFVMGISTKKDLRFFKTKEEALAWLKVEKSP